VFGCRYRPEPKERGDAMEDYEITDLNPDNRDGGYFIGARVKPRSFSLSCFFEDITEAQLEGIYRWLDRRQSGELIFDSKPYAAYDVHPSKKIQIVLYDHEADDGSTLYSGTFTAYFTCYTPFGRLLHNSCTGTLTPEETSGTGLLPSGMMPAAPTISSTSFLMYNPGTENADTVIRLTGSVGSGLTVRNLTTGQRCRVTGLTASSLLTGEQLCLDSRCGQTYITGGTEDRLAFALHDEGYIRLAPCTPVVRNAEIVCTNGSNAVTSAGLFTQDMKGQYIYQSGWVKIADVTDATHATLSRNATVTGTVTTPIITMNEIELIGTDAALTGISIDYTSYVR